MKLYYDKPYTKLKRKKIKVPPKDSIWEQTALPLGNGSLGLSVLGGVRQEQLTLNCKSFWTGGPSEKRPDYCGGNICGKDRHGKTRYDYFQETREAFLRGDDEAGSRLCEQLIGEKDGYGAYQWMGDIYIDLDTPRWEKIAYRRELDLDTAVCQTTIRRKRHGTPMQETRRGFVSYPDRVAVYRVEQSGAPFSAAVTYPVHHGATLCVQADGISQQGFLEDNGLYFAAVVRLKTDGQISAENGIWRCENATELTLYIAADTDYDDNYPVYRSQETPDAVFARIKQTAQSACEKGFDAVLQAAVADYRALFSRLHFSLGRSVDVPTDQLLRDYPKKHCAPETRRTLETLLYAYGRYLTIAASRETDILPANLQGIWNHRNAPMWSSDYHLNINLQMNYWPTCSGNLAECAAPLLRYVRALCAPGRKTAEIYTGVQSTADAPNGFLYHTQNTPFGWTCPGWEFSWGWSPVAVAWILHNVYEIYQYTRDRQMLQREIYPMLRESADYFESLLVEKDGRLVSIPCFSPEHGPRTAGNTYEQSLLWQLFTDAAAAAQALETDADKAAHWTSIAERLHPIEIGDSGQIKEWYHETVLGSVGVKHHRHLSHLLGLYPGNLIDRCKNPEYIEAAKISLDDRQDRSTGWAMAQRICSRARTLEGDRALSLIGLLVRYGLYVNLWDVHPPFQIDGNYGYTAAVNELLMQSHTGHIDILPALPQDWANGEINGLVARGNFELCFAWQNGRLQTLTVKSRAGGICKIRTENAVLALPDGQESVYDETGCLVFSTQKGQQYTLRILA